MIDLDKLPQYRIDLVNYLTANVIKQNMKSSKVRSYVYAFIHKNTVMKYGVQYDCDDDTHGERIYRQAFHIPGWPKVPSPRSAGNDMLEVIKNFPGINKNDVSILIWDMTHYPRADSKNPKYEVNVVERQLIKEHIKQHGEKPIGNIKDEAHMDNKAHIKDVVFNNFFLVDE